jgi:hypothetical protein
MGGLFEGSLQLIQQGLTLMLTFSANWGNGLI